LAEKGKYTIEALKDEELNIIRAKLLSRHSSIIKYNIYIQYDSSKTGTDAIIGWMCRCKNGLRTLGCCAHVASVIYYFSYGRYLENIKSPASFLTGLFPHAPPITLETSDDE
jgi:hypothetical protein